jgi:hypothetical protein
MTTAGETIAPQPSTPPFRFPDRGRVKGTRLTRTAVVLAVLLGTGAGSAAVAQAATTGANNSSKASAQHGVRTPPAAFGTVESVGTGTFTVKERKGTTVTVDVTSSTTYRDGKVTSPTFANVTTGEMVVVEGTTASGIVTAKSVLIGMGGGMGHNHRHGPGPA